MASSRNTLRLFSIYFILSIQYSFNGASPLSGETVEEVPLGKFSFIVSLHNKTLLRVCRTELFLARELAHFCGGSLITPYHVLTAGHCVIPFNAQFHEVEVVIGSTNLRAVADVREVSWWITFSKFNNVTYSNKKLDDLKESLFDIAIIKLNTPVQDIELPTISYIPTEELYNKSVVIAGWGLNENNVMSSYMHMGTFTIVDPWANPEKYKTTQTIGNRHLRETLTKICFYTDALTTHTRSGDSGSPVLLYNGGYHDYPNNIVGVHSSGCVVINEGVSCQLLNRHTPINNFRDFIESVTKITDDTLRVV